MKTVPSRPNLQPTREFATSPSAVQTGRLVLLSGLVGSGKTHLLARIEDELTRAGRVAVSRSLAVEKTRVTLSTLIEALSYDLGDKNVVIPKQPEKRERELRDLVRKAPPSRRADR